ncbi:alpha/beta fold hydrolase [Virgisporangium aliadipatigenens]|nr:alpha/beta fold hydrolase [Virgisporangium aliadipatigenens]
MRFDRERFLAAYSAALDALWPPHASFEVAGPFGVTRGLRLGPATGEPVVLLHGWGSNAVAWYPTARLLGDSRPVYAIDTLGDAGRSVQHAPISGPDDSAAWLDGVLDGLGLDRAHLVGESYGGWLALNVAARWPGRVASLTVLDPIGLVPLRKRFYVWIVACGSAALAPRPVRHRAATWLTAGALREDGLRRVSLAAVGFKQGIRPPAVLDDASLRRITVPVTVLLGARSAAFDAVRAADRAALLPHGRVEIVPGAGHALRLDRPDVVDRILTG